MSESPEAAPSRFVPRLVVTSFCFALAANLLVAVWHPAFFEHLGIGLWMLDSGGLPESNIWVREGFTQAWNNPSWLFDLVMALVFSKFSGSGLLIAFYFCLVFCLGVLSWVFSSLARNLVVGTFIASLVFAGSFYLGTFEPSLLGLPLLAVVFLIAQRGVTSCVSFAVLCAVLALGSLISALDPRSAICLPILALYFVLVPNNSRSLAKLAVSLALLAAPFISPYRGAQFLQALQQILNETQSHLASQAHVATLFDYGWSVLLLLLGCFMLSATRARTRGIDIALIVGLSLLATADKSFIPVALLFSGLLYARFWGVHIQGLMFIPGLVEALRRFEAQLVRMRPFATGGSWLMLCIAFVNAFGVRHSPIAEAYYPSEVLIQEIKRINDGVLLHDLEIGSFLIYKRGVEKDPFDEATLPIASLQFPFEQSSGLTFWQSQIARPEVKVVLCKSGSVLDSLLQFHTGWKIFDETLSDGEVATKRPLWKLYSRI